MEADDTHSEMSENICEIKKYCETDMEGIMSRVKNNNASDKHSTGVWDYESAKSTQSINIWNCIDNTRKTWYDKHYNSMI